IELRNGVELHLEDGALLQLSDLEEHYRYFKLHPVMAPDRTWPVVIFGDHVTDVSITGKGCIDGGGRRFWGEPPIPGADYRWYKRLERWRPHLIGLVGCRNVTLSGITVNDPPVYGANLISCTDIKIDRVR